MDFYLFIITFLHPKSETLGIALRKFFFFFNSLSEWINGRQFGSAFGNKWLRWLLLKPFWPLSEAKWQRRGDKGTWRPFTTQVTSCGRLKGKPSAEELFMGPLWFGEERTRVQAMNPSWLATSCMQGTQTFPAKHRGLLQLFFSYGNGCVL